MKGAVGTFLTASLFIEEPPDLCVKRKVIPIYFDYPDTIAQS